MSIPTAVPERNPHIMFVPIMERAVAEPTPRVYLGVSSVRDEFIGFSPKDEGSLFVRALTDELDEVDVWVNELSTLLCEDMQAQMECYNLAGKQMDDVAGAEVKFRPADVLYGLRDLARDVESGAYNGGERIVRVMWSSAPPTFLGSGKDTALAHVLTLRKHGPDVGVHLIESSTSLSPVIRNQGARKFSIHDGLVLHCDRVKRWCVIDGARSVDWFRDGHPFTPGEPSL